MAGNADPSLPGQAPSATDAGPPASVLVSRSEPSDTLRRAISSGPRYDLYEAFNYSSDPTITAMEALRRTDCEPMLTEAYNGIQFILRGMADISRIMNSNSQIDNIVVRAVDHLNNWTLDFQRVLDGVKSSVDDLDGQTQSEFNIGIVAHGRYKCAWACVQPSIISRR